MTPSVGRETTRDQTAGKKSTILVVEDEELMLHLLQKTFSRKGYEVLAAADGEEAIEIYHACKHTVDVVLLDVGLPKISGIDVFFRMKEENPEIRAVIVSGFLDPEIKAEMFRAGVRHFFAKPYAFDEIIDAFQDLIER
jgi:two-component system, cell cycle sensor histidine kinase and response regulator CckA